MAESSLNAGPQIPGGKVLKGHHADNALIMTVAMTKIFEIMRSDDDAEQKVNRISLICERIKDKTEEVKSGKSYDISKWDE